jgi:type I restriction enzyme R subunit
VVTDRRILDDQIQKTVKQFMQVGATVGHAEHSGDLRKFIEEGKKIIISTVQKFPFILDEIAKEEKGKTFAIIIDEAHSSQGGKTSSAMSAALADPEDTVNDALEKRMQARKMLTNASYFAFTATPKPKTLEMFGQPLPPDAEGKIKHRPFHSYTMKQAIQEGFILDVLKSYTPWTATTSWSRRSRATRSSTPSGRRRSCGSMSRATTTPSASRRRSWWTISTSR